MNFLNFAKKTVSLSQQLSKYCSLNRLENLNFTASRNFSLSHQKCNLNEDVNKILLEFFDDKKNWNENEVKHGRSWLLPELRIKSNTDLHKLWYILLKERNMLKTMEHEHKKQWRYFASPERIDKVEDSMKNIETVVRERNRAYFQLEVGHPGEQPVAKIYNPLGLKEEKRLEQHAIPYHLNTKFQEENPRSFRGHAVRKFLRLYKEKETRELRKERNRERNHVKQLLSRFPDLDRKLLAKKYPSVNIEYHESRNQIKGHYVPKID